MSALPTLTWTIDPILWHGAVTLRWFNLFWWIELALGFRLLLDQVRRGGGDAEEAGDLALHVWLGLILGARLGQGLVYDLPKTLADPGWILTGILQGGMSSHGAALGTLLAIHVFTKRRGMSLWEAGDRLAYSFALGSMIHRIANLFNSEIVGRPTDGSWGLRFPRFDSHVLEPPLRHPSQLYEAALGLIVLGALLMCDRAWGREARPRGALSAVLLLTYFSGRIAVEFFKEPQAGEPVDVLLNRGQIMSIPFVVLGACLLSASLKRRAPAGWLLPR